MPTFKEPVIEQNFLPKMFFEKLSKIVNSGRFQWFFNDSDLYGNAKKPI